MQERSFRFIAWHITVSITRRYLINGGLDIAMRYVYLFLYSSMVSVCTGIATFGVSLKWFPIREMLRSLSVDALIFALLLLLPAKASHVDCLILFLPLLLLSFISVEHIAIYRSGISSFSVISSLETSANEATEFFSEFVTLPIRGQDAKHPTRYMFDVPFIIWMSDKYRQANPKLAARVEARVNEPFSLNWFADTAADLARVSFEGVTPGNSLFATHYRLPGKRDILYGGDYDKLPALRK